MTIRQLIYTIKKDIQHEHNKSILKGVFRNNDGVARCQGRISAFEDIKSKLEKCIDDNVIEIPNNEIEELLKDIKEYRMQIEDYGKFNSTKEKEQTEKIIEGVNDTVEDIIYEVRDFFDIYR